MLFQVLKNKRNVKNRRLESKSAFSLKTDNNHLTASFPGQSG